MAARLRPRRVLGPGCRGLPGSADAPVPHVSVLVLLRLQLPSTSALFYIEGGFYTSGPAGLSTTQRTRPNRACSSTHRSLAALEVYLDNLAG